MSETDHFQSSPTLRFTAWVLVVLFGSIVAGSWFAKTEIVARGSGRIVSTVRTQTVQPQFSGQILSLPVRDGDSVLAGQVIMTLVPTSIESEIARLQSELARQDRQLRLSQSILEPLIAYSLDRHEQLVDRGASKASFSFGQSGDEAFKALVGSVLFSIQAQLSEADAEIAQIRSSLKTQQTRATEAEAEFSLMQERNASAEALRKKGTISNTTYLDRLRETSATKAGMLVSRNQLDELNAKLNLVKRRRERIVLEALAQYRKSVAEAKDSIEGLQANIVAAQNHLRNTVLFAPVDGKIENLKVHTLGGHVQAGQDIMSVVPADAPLEIEAFFENRDAGFLAPGQRAIIKLDAFPAERFGYLKGRVTQVGADARQMEDTDGWVYAAQIKLDQTHVEREGEQFALSSGMTGMIDVVTGERRLISYFFEPIIKAIQDGLGER